MQAAALPCTPGCHLIAAAAGDRGSREGWHSCSGTAAPWRGKGSQGQEGAQHWGRGLPWPLETKPTEEMLPVGKRLLGLLLFWGNSDGSHALSQNQNKTKHF